MSESLSISSPVSIQSREIQGPRLLVIDSDPRLLQFVQQAFSNTDITVQTAESGREGLRQLYNWRPNLVLLDLLVPDMDGWQILAYMQEATDISVIVTSTVDTVDEVARALDAGAIDYITKPFLSRILVARVRAALRTLRRSLEPTALAYADTYLWIDTQTQRVWVNGHQIHLTTNERKLLFYLVKQANQVCSYAELLQHIWGWEYRESTQYIHVYISHLRQKIEQDPKRPLYFQTVHGVGYQFQKQQ